ncbi:DUF2493 domain-containing protein [Mycolicibacterium sphagni]|uniref:YspA cpYpsA-related SLOG domain-containing protein n=1 Tax=Mycolicibacterium sphagni TaxID=1786 RepID=A0A255DQV5_9MYCO|nr:DUF2493 domain-containing protein [Mycolicibacterium sphagni]OYN81736.1 hypothetical protein CG716_05115 [Mycolicibacterium sphagni]
MSKRILVTGSRDWSNWELLHLALYAQTKHFEDAIIVHGCAPGADTIARRYAGGRVGVTAEGHPAEWDKPCGTGCYHRPRFKNGKPYCPLQGHFRNQLMVDLGADLCLAFPLGESRGTRDCMKRAERAGIRVINYGDD